MKRSRPAKKHGVDSSKAVQPSGGLPPVPSPERRLHAAAVWVDRLSAELDALDPLVADHARDTLQRVRDVVGRVHETLRPSPKKPSVEEGIILDHERRLDAFGADLDALSHELHRIRRLRPMRTTARFRRRLTGLFDEADVHIWAMRQALDAARHPDPATVPVRVGDRVDQFADVWRALDDRLGLTLRAVHATRNAYSSRFANLLHHLRHRPVLTAKRALRRASGRGDFALSVFDVPEARLAALHGQVTAVVRPVAAVEEGHSAYAALRAAVQQDGLPGVWVIGALKMGWHEVFKQRHHHIAEYLMRKGYVVVCAMNPDYPRDVTGSLKREGERLFLANFDDRRLWRKTMDFLIAHSAAPITYSLNPTEPGTTPEDAAWLQSAGVRMFYDYFDELSPEIFPGVTPMHYARHEAFLADPSVVVCTTAANLYDKATRTRRDNVFLSKNGVRLEDWVLPADPPVPAELRPVLQQARGKKIVGFYGSFAPWLDYAMFTALAERRPDVHLVMIGYDYEWGKGAFAKSGLAERPNVHILPAQKYDRLKYFSRFFDVGVVPFRIYELTISVSPVKMFEYMAQGIPVVTSDMPECRLYPSCLIARDPDEFVQRVDEAFALARDPKYQQQLAHDAAANTWEKRADDVDRAVRAAQARDAARPPSASEGAPPLLSIAIPTYNMEKLLPRLLEDLAAMPLLRGKVEVIVVNDGSTDGSLALAREFERKAPDLFRVIDKPNGGHGSCINAGLDAARGRYFRLVDADDRLNGGSLVRVLRFLEDADVDALVNDYVRFDPDDREELITYADRLDPDRVYDFDGIVHALHRDLSHLCYLHMHALTWRTQVLRDADLRITEHSFYVDQEYITFPLPFAKTFAYRPWPLYRYLVGRPGQSVNPAVFLKRLGQHFAVFDRLRTFMEREAPDPSSPMAQYLTRILFHHCWFHLEYTDQEDGFNEMMRWWSANPSRRMLARRLRRAFSTDLKTRDTAKARMRLGGGVGKFLTRRLARLLRM